METYTERLVTIFDAPTSTYRPFCFYDQMAGLGLDPSQNRQINDDEWRMFNFSDVSIPIGLDRDEFLSKCYNYSYLWKNTKLSDFDIEMQKWMMQFSFGKTYILVEYMRRKSRSDNTTDLQRAIKLSVITNSTEYPLSDQKVKDLLHWEKGKELLNDFHNFCLDRNTKFGFYKI